MTPSQQDVTKLLIAWGNGDQNARDELMPLVYDELHRLAHQYMARERQSHTLQTSGLVNEAFLRLVDQRDVLAKPCPLLWHCCANDAAHSG